MSDQLSIADMPIATVSKPSNVVISPWVNEPHPPLHKLLSSHDVARLTRRPLWLLTSLSLIGRFPKKAKFQGRAIGWRQSEVLDWMARDLNVAERAPAKRVCPRRRAQQACLPLNCAAPCSPRRNNSETRKRKPELPARARR
jgi:predicted DNA-binding transcriptional regulator AlpA